MIDEELPKKGWGWLQWIAVTVVVLLGASLLVPSYGLITVSGNQLKASGNARQILGFMLTWAVEHNGFYPDHELEASSLTSNEVFRRLFKDGIIQDERVFGCPGSRYNPDNNSGEPPGYDQALSPGENHWAMVAGVRIDSLWRCPVIFENT